MSELAQLLRGADPTGASTVADKRSGLSRPEWLRSAEELGHRVRETAVRPRPLLLVDLPAGADAVLALGAAVLSDSTLCFLDPAGTPERREAVIGAVDPDVVLDAEGLRARAPRTGDRSGGEVAAGYVAVSSGSTSSVPKGVLTRWSTLAAFLPAGVEALELDAASTWAEPSHPAFDMAITNLLMALACGASVHVSGAMADKLRPLAFSARVGATHVRLAPRFVELADVERRRGTPVSVRVWGSGGDRLGADTARQVLDLGVPTLVNTYGTSETAGFASSAVFRAGDPLDEVHGTVSIGRGAVGGWGTSLVSGQVDGEDREMLAVRTPVTGDGYLFGAAGADYPRWEPGGRVLTGDLGALQGGELFCLGRAGRTVKRAGTFVNLADVDRRIASSTGASTFTVATPDGRLVALVAGGAGGGRPSAQLFASAGLSPDSTPEAVVAVAELPRLANGKIDQGEALRQACLVTDRGRV